ncbi:histone-lysine N-methyltransferase SETMAR [Trichonephila clavipes]|nr:histone-lysine N-methyltransferase SETMAR [Trichonephila clavipes]
MKRTYRFSTFQHVKEAKSTGLVKASKLEVQKTVTANWYDSKYLPEISKEMNVSGLMLHHDSASSITAGLTVEFLKQKQIKVIGLPPYSPVLAMYDIWLFFNLKKNFRGRRFYSKEYIDVDINAYFHQFQEMNVL